MENQEIKANMNTSKEIYKSMFLKIRNILNYHDPELLKPGRINGSPDDEYDLESSKITSFFLKRQDLTQEIIAAEVNKIWLEFFGKDCCKLRQISSDLIQLIKE